MFIKAVINSAMYSAEYMSIFSVAHRTLFQLYNNSCFIVLLFSSNTLKISVRFIYPFRRRLRTMLHNRIDRI